METELANLLAEVEQRYPVKVNEYCRKLAERSAAVSRRYLPDPRELEDLGLSSDGLAEREQSPVPKLIRRYTDRAVVLTTTECYVRCRFWLIFFRTVVFRASSYHRCLLISRTNAKTHFLYIK